MVLRLHWFFIRVLAHSQTALKHPKAAVLNVYFEMYLYLHKELQSNSERNLTYMRLIITKTKKNIKHNIIWNKDLACEHWQYPNFFLMYYLI